MSNIVNLFSPDANPFGGGSAGIGGIGGIGGTGGSNELKELLKEFKNPGQLLMYLLYVYLPMKEKHLKDFVGSIGKQLHAEAKLLDKWDDLQNDLTQIGEYATEFKRGVFIQKHPFKIVIGVYDNPALVKKFKAAVDNFEKDLKSFKALLKKDTTPDKNGNTKIPVNKDTKTFLETIESSLKNLEDSPKATVYTGNKDHFVDGSLSGIYGGFLKMFRNEDQTQLKAYMNNINTGNTAFSSISNYTQEEQQLYGKQYDSGEGLIKSGLKAFTTQEQTMVNNQRSS